MKNKTIVILARKGTSTNIIYNSLKNEFNIEKVVTEKPLSRFKFLKKRAKRIRLFTLFGQILFRIIIVPLAGMFSRKRMLKIKGLYKLDDTPIDAHKIINVESANSDKTISILKGLSPDIVIINGTCIISDKLIGTIPAKFINLHTGITPLYRGVYGAYWALVENNKNACGVTVHFVDSGIDTGRILEQGVIEPTKEDNIATYFLLQLGVGIPLLKKAIKNIFENTIEFKPYPQGLSKLWSHPTLWGYIRHRVR